MGAKVGPSKGGMDEINVTPLIDVVLVLLIIFMVLTPITLQKMAAELPPIDDDTPPPPPSQQDEQLMVAIYDDSSLALNLVPMDEARLQEELQKRLRGRPSAKRNVFVDAAPEAIYEQVVHIVDVARDSGAERVGFADMKDEGPGRLTPEQAAMLAAGTLVLPTPGAPATPPVP